MTPLLIILGFAAGFLAALGVVRYVTSRVVGVSPRPKEPVNTDCRL